MQVNKTQLVDDVRQALYAAKICSYAQGMNLIREAGKQLGWTINLGECARIWKGGCIIRAKVCEVSVFFGILTGFGGILCGAAVFGSHQAGVRQKSRSGFVARRSRVRGGNKR